MNTSLVTGVVQPDTWKVAVVQPIYESSGTIRDPANFRPISLVPCLAKIVERIVHRQLYAYFDSNHLLDHATWISALSNSLYRDSIDRCHRPGA